MHLTVKANVADIDSCSAGEGIQNTVIIIMNLRRINIG